MNKPASKEPSMDEILSSIRQIIADDDAAAPRKPPVPPIAAAPAAAAAPRPATVSPLRSQPVEEPLALSPEQIIGDQEEDDAEGVDFSEFIRTDAEHAAADRAPPQLVDPEDITFESDELEDESALASEPMPVREPAAPPQRAVPPPQPPPRAAPSVARAAPMPDPTLSRDMAEQLLEPTTNAAVKHTFAKLSGLSAVGSTVTLEALMRDMLRPMLKDWLDENLPSVVERMVEKEIARISRGGE